MACRHPRPENRSGKMCGQARLSSGGQIPADHSPACVGDCQHGPRGDRFPVSDLTCRRPGVETSARGKARVRDHLVQPSGSAMTGGPVRADATKLRSAA